MTNENIKKKVEFEGKLLDCLIKILDDTKEKGTQPDNSTIQIMINYKEVIKS